MQQCPNHHLCTTRLSEPLHPRWSFWHYLTIWPSHFPSDWVLCWFLVLLGMGRKIWLIYSRKILSNVPLPPHSIQAKPAVSVSSWKPLHLPGFYSVSIPFNELMGHQTHHSSCHSGESTSGLRLGTVRVGVSLHQLASVLPALRKP